MVTPTDKPTGSGKESVRERFASLAKVLVRERLTRLAGELRGSVQSLRSAQRRLFGQTFVGTRDQLREHENLFECTSCYVWKDVTKKDATVMSVEVCKSCKNLDDGEGDD